jgi:hypothetical protein
MARKKQSKFKDKVSADTTRQKNAESNYGYLKLPKGVNIFSPDEGKVRLDILPYLVTDEKHPDRNEEMEIAIPGELWYKRPFKVHRNIGAENDTVVCLASFGQRCPICEYLAKRRKEGADMEEIKALRPSQRNLYVVVPIGVKGMEEKPHIWDVSQYLFQNLLNEELEEDPDYAAFPDLEEGLTLRIRFEEQQLGKNKFNEAKRIDFEEREEIYEDSILEEVPNLDEVLTKLSYEELDAKFLEMESTDEVEDPPPARKRKKVEKEPEPEPEPEEDDDPPPVRRKKKPAKDKEEDAPPVRRKRKPEPEPEPEPEEDDAFEEDEEPPVSRKSKSKFDEKAKRNKAKDDDERCPHGHRFGVDCEDFDDCDVCEIWDECIEVKEANE